MGAFFSMCGPFSVVMGGGALLGLPLPGTKMSVGAYEQARQTRQNSGGGGLLQSASQDLTKEWGCNNFFLYAKKISPFRVSSLGG